MSGPDPNTAAAAGAGPAAPPPAARHRWMPALAAAGCLVAAVVAGGHPVVGPVTAGVSAALVVGLAGMFGTRRRPPSGAQSVAALAACIVAAVWLLRGAGAVLEVAGFAGAGSIALWPIPLVIALGLYGPLSRIGALGLVSDWFLRGTINRPGLWLTAAIVPVAALVLVLWSLATGEDGSGFDTYRRILADQGAAVLVLGALVFSFVNAAAEEAAYNGVAQRAFGLDLGRVLAVVLAAAMFGASHWYGFPNGWWGVLLATAYGLVLSVLRQVSHGLLLPWVAHVLADLTIVALLLTLW
ncbi:CPBP family intramembrane glutamic endopeptidase [Promicromonospora sp. NPDC023987]|uniref:CPBP family intramembrane glutamic endopeptidase n=1 Tax=Promicromonospora sp. NPDC023987 TaxID=3155360 RepID=UPI0033C538A6